MQLPTSFRAALLLAGFLLGADTYAQQTLHTIKVSKPKDIRAFFKYTGQDIPIISGHRGGVVEGFPENSIAAMEQTLRATPAFFEVDPRLTKDSVIVLMHDATLDRTTTGSGKVSDHTWEELKALRLKDVKGNVTEHRIPTLEEAIAWSKGKTILNLDKKDVPLEMTAALLQKQKAEAHVMVTVHTAAQAKFYYDRNKDIMFSAFVKTRKALEEYEAAGIPWSHMIAYIGPQNKPENKVLFDLLHQRGVMCMISAAPSYDKLTDTEAQAQAYRGVFQGGADILESDYPVKVAEAVLGLFPAKSSKKKFFGRARQ
ncbi:glycerophosphodiester phosphodiesterase family protein [Rufibacter psychrotolerans]|uniref:glycerophosphodiester phosphodiesterase family protein n=1 Tax=Rufibacter psychrotolerans TaxID=2812556 RepID=UPI0019683085|nr:glycerophosphodiester phosphodiesterase family protein [Rufibacter sp. SYSU D00308]